MAQTYTPALTDSISKIRLLLGERSASGASFQDEEVTAALTLTGNIYDAAAMLADSLAAEYSRKADVSVDGLRVSWSKRADSMRQLATNLRGRATMSAAGGLGTPFVGGVSQAAIETQEDDTDRTPSRVTTDLHDMESTMPEDFS